jgi:hypothetical protein
MNNRRDTRGLRPPSRKLRVRYETMPGNKNLKGECQRCGAYLEFPAERIGLTARCPHCRQETELVLAPPPQEPVIPRRVMIWTVVTVLLMIAALMALLARLNQLERRAAEQRQKGVVPAHGDSNSPAKPGPKAGNR